MAAHRRPRRTIRRLAPDVEKQLNVTFHPNVESLVKAVDVVSVHSPLYDDTRRMFNKQLISTMQSREFKSMIARLPGYDASRAGEITSIKKVFPWD